MLRLRFFDPVTRLMLFDQQVESCRISQALGKSGEWQTTVPATAAEAALLEQGGLVEIYYQGRLLLTGRAQTMGYSFQTDSNTVSLSGRDAIDELYEAPGYSLALYKDTPLLLALGDLLHQAGWQLGDVSTIPNPETVKINLDLRQEPQLTSQITKVCEAVTKLSYRYGGIVDGVPTIDFGYFGRKSGISFISGPSDDAIANDVDGFLTASDTVGYNASMTFDLDFNDVIWGMEAWGGEVTDSSAKRQISLHDALLDDPTLPTATDFPVLEQLYKNKHFIYDAARCQYPGGVSQHNQAGAATTAPIGNNSASNSNHNYQYAVWMYPTPGRLKAVYFDTAATEVGTITDPLRWWLYRGGTYPTPGELVATGEIGTWVVDTRFQFILPDDVIIEPGIEYVFHYGFDNDIGYAVSTYKTIVAANVTPAMLTSRQSVWTPRLGIGWAAYTTTVTPLTVITERIGTPLGGGRLETLTESNTGSNAAVASAADLKAAGRQVRQWCIAYMNDRKGDRTVYNLSVASDVIPPRIGDSVYIRGIATGAVTDPFTEIPQEFKKEVKGDFRVESLQLEFQNDVLTLAAAVSNNTGLTNQDIYVQLYSAIKKTPVQGTVFLGMLTPQMTTETPTVSGGAADTVMSDGSPGRLFTLPLPTAPSFTWQLFLLGIPYGTASRGTPVVEVVTNPTYTTGAVIRVSINRNWISSDSVNLTCNYLWY